MSQVFLEKYKHIIAEEVNVKEVALLPASLEVTKTYVPLGKALSADFGKDTGRIIAAAKQGNVEEKDAGNILVKQGNDSRTLTSEQYEIRYSGLSGDNQIVEEGTLVELDLEITPALYEEGVAREFSRFLNQMRKDADYQVSDRVACSRSSSIPLLEKVMKEYTVFLQQEALLSTLVQEEQTGDITAIYSCEEGDIRFTLRA